MSVLRVSIIVLTLATAIIHVVVAFGSTTPSSSDVPFVLNAAGYVGLIGLLYLPIPQLDGYRGPIRVAFILFTVLTIVLYFVFAGFAFDPVGYLDKAIEVVLISLLVVEARVPSPGQARDQAA